MGNNGTQRLPVGEEEIDDQGDEHAPPQQGKGADEILPIMKTQHHKPYGDIGEPQHVGDDKTRKKRDVAVHPAVNPIAGNHELLKKGELLAQHGENQKEPGMGIFFCQSGNQAFIDAQSAPSFHNLLIYYMVLSLQKQRKPARFHAILRFAVPP